MTGLGILAANGIGQRAFWRTLIAGESGIDRVTLFDASGLDCQIAGEVHGFDPGAYVLMVAKPKREARNTLLALAAASLAIEDAGLARPLPTSSRPVIVAMGVSTSSFDIIEEGIRWQEEQGLKSARHQIITSSGIQMPANTIATQLGARSETRTVATACAAGQDAIAQAAAILRSGRADVALAGGSDAPISGAPFANFCSLGMLSRRNDCPRRASRPFDLRRDGGVLAEGAAVVVLETLEHARYRGAVPYAELLGGATAMDMPGTTGNGLAASMRLAMDNAGVLAREIDHISAHGPSDPVLDSSETAMIRAVFGLRAQRLPVSSIKGVTGNPLAAAGAMQVVAACLALRHQVLPMTANYEHRDPTCDLDYVTEASRPAAVGRILVNNHGISGGNSSLVISRMEEP